MSKRPVILPKLRSFAIKDFRPIFTASAGLELRDGTNLILGGNGLGKTTLMQAVVYGMAGGTEEIDEDKASRWNHHYFLERLDPAAAESAVVEVTFELGHMSIAVRRGFEGSRVLACRIGDDQGWIAGGDEAENAYVEALDRFGAYRSLRDFAFIVHKLLYLPETRRLIAWDTDTQLKILLLLNQDIAPTGDFDERREMLLRLDSAKRHTHVEVNKALKEIEKSKPVRGKTAKTGSHENDAAKELQELTLELQRVGRERIVAETTVDSANESLSEVSDEIETTRGQLDVAEAEVIWSSIAAQEKESALPVQKLLDYGICPVCGTHQPDLQAIALRHHHDHSCTLCGSEVAQLQDVNLATLRSSLSKRLRDKTELERNLQYAQVRLADLRKNEASLQRRVNEIRFSLPAIRDESSAGASSRAQLIRKSRQLMATEADLAAQIRELGEQLEHDYARFRRAVTTRAGKLRQTYTRYATEFLGIPCELIETENDDRLLSLMRFVPMFEGVERRTPNSCSEAQRFFLDIAFRMALIDLASELTELAGTFLCETPETALDFTYVENVVRMFQKFASEDHTVLLTCNLQSQGIAEQLLEGMPAEEKRARVLNLLEIGRLSSVHQQNKGKIDRAVRKILR